MPMSNSLSATVLNTYYTSRTLYLALHTADPTVTGNSTTELTGGSYVRLVISFTAPSNRSVANSASITFTNLPATTVAYFGIWDASTGGTMQHSIQAGSGINISAGGTLYIPVNDIAVALT